MKSARILVLAPLLAIAFSCSKSDDAKPTTSSLESASLSFSGQSQVASAPSAMASSQDPQAQMATSYVTSVNAITGYLSYFKPPSGAVKSSNAITASNARVAGTQKEYLVYTWTDANSSTSIGYQVSEESDKYIFEIFYKAKSQASWLRYVYAEEKKDHSSGLMKIYNIFTGDAKTVLIDYTWTRKGDILDFVMSSSQGGFDFKIAISINQTTKAGSVTYTLEGAKFYDMTWDAKGNGSWNSYDQDGVTILDSGTWTVA